MDAHAALQPTLPALSDAELAYMAQSALAWNRELFPAGVRVSAAAGWLTLSGEVLWNYQRQDAVECVRHLPGVVGVRNDITLRRAEAGLKDAP